MISFKRIGLAVAGVAAGTLLFGTAASAHECYIANRSDRGDLMALNSGRWVALTPADIAMFTPPGTNQGCFVSYWLSHDGPASLTIRSDKTIGEGSQNPNLANGKGLEHAQDVFGGLFEAAVEDCS